MLRVNSIASLYISLKLNICCLSEGYKGHGMATKADFLPQAENAAACMGFQEQNLVIACRPVVSRRCFILLRTVNQIVPS